MRLAVSTSHRFYIAITFFALISIMRFWPTYFGPLLVGTVDQSPVSHIRAAVFSGWLATLVS